MFHKVKAVNALPDYRLSVPFAEGVTKIYDVKPLFAKWVPLLFFIIPMMWLGDYIL